MPSFTSKKRSTNHARQQSLQQEVPKVGGGLKQSPHHGRLKKHTFFYDVISSCTLHFNRALLTGRANNQRPHGVTPCQSVNAAPTRQNTPCLSPRGQHIPRQALLKGDRHYRVTRRLGIPPLVFTRGARQLNTLQCDVGDVTPPWWVGYYGTTTAANFATKNNGGTNSKPSRLHELKESGSQHNTFNSAPPLHFGWDRREGRCICVPSPGYHCWASLKGEATGGSTRAETFTDQATTAAK